MFFSLFTTISAYNTQNHPDESERDRKMRTSAPMEKSMREREGERMGEWCEIRLKKEPVNDGMRDIHSWYTYRIYICICIYV